MKIIEINEEPYLKIKSWFNIMVNKIVNSLQ
jgi:hypothetical protein